MNKKSKRQTILVGADIAADLTGYGAAQRPTPAHLRLVKHYASPLLFGPANNELLLELIMHMFTEDEADVAQHLPPLRPRRPEKIAHLSGRSLENVQRTLDDLAFTKRVILAYGDPRKYTILPIVPGTFEMVLMTNDLANHNQWHRRFAEAFEKVWKTDYMADYPGKRKYGPVRYLPVADVGRTLQQAWPSDRLEEILEPYADFAVGHCQCRMSARLVGGGCDKPTENCVTIGPLVKAVVERGMMRRVDKAEILAIKREAEAAGCVTFVMNESKAVRGKAKGNGSCSCCGCCCKALTATRQLNIPGMLSRPHFMPKQRPEACKLCKKCVAICPMNAWTVIEDRLSFNPVRCIGCGLCVRACRFGALELEPVPDAREPYFSPSDIVLGFLPTYLGTTLRVWLQRLIN